MPQPFRVKFDEDGKRCPKNIQQLRRLPECGIFDRDLLPLHPVNPPKPPPPDPDHPFRPYTPKGGPTMLNDRLIPDLPERPSPRFPPATGDLVGGATGEGSQYSAPRLPQDETNLGARGGLRVLRETPAGYDTVPTELQGGDALARPLQPLDYRNEEADRVIRSLDDVVGSAPRQTDVELADLLVGGEETAVEQAMREAMIETDVIPRPRRLPTGDPRDTEFGERPTERPAFRRFRRPARVSPPPRMMGAEAPARRRGVVSAPETEMTVLRQRPLATRYAGMRNVDAPLEPVGEERVALAGRKRRGDYFELEQGEEQYRARITRPTSQLQQRAEQLQRNIRLASESAKRMRLSLAEGARATAQDIRATAVRQFGQGYERVVTDTEGIRRAQMISGERPVGAGRPIPGDIEMGAIRSNIATTETGDITVRRPVTEDVTGLREIDLDFSPFEQVVDEPTVIGRARPKLSFSERLGAARASFKDVTPRAAAGATGAAGVGFLTGLGVSQLMGGTDYTHNKFANAAIVGGASGASGDVFARTASAIAQRTFSTSVADTAANTAAFTAMRAGSAVLRGGAEGLIVGAATAPLDLLLNNALMSSGQFSHATANITSSGVVGLGTTAAIGAVSLAAAPETLGLSLVVGGIATLGSIIFGGVSGAIQDQKEKDAREQAQKAQQHIRDTASARQQLIASLPANNYDFKLAYQNFLDKKSLGVNDSTWSSFRTFATTLFNRRPSNTPAPSPSGGAAASGDQKRLNDLFSKYITHDLIERVCTGGKDCSELRTRDTGPLTTDEIQFLDKQTAETWRPQADMQVEMSVQELSFTQKRIADAKKAMIDSWNRGQTLPQQMDSYTVQTAYLDPEWEDRFATAIKFDAQRRVIDAYARDQTKLEKMPPNIRRAALSDERDFATAMHAYYDDMEHAASQLEVTIPQLIELQKLEGDAQQTRYQQFQFDRIKTQTDVVESAGHLAKEQDTARAAGFYDLDQAFLETDPTDIEQWHPSDSQILQAHAAGMNLNQYVAYMHELAKGTAGDFKKLPTYTAEQLRQYGLEDRDHFFDELAMVYGEGAGRQMYDYDPETRTFTPKQGVHLLPNHNEASAFISRYTPAYLTKARKEYADMIHGLNERNQAQVDAYNSVLRQEISEYGVKYNQMVADQNAYLLMSGANPSQLLHYNADEVYMKNRLEYNPLSDALPDHERQVVGRTLVSAPNLPAAGESARYARTEAAAARYDLSVDQYHTLKHNIQSQDVTDPSPQRVAQEVADIKKIDVAPS